MVLLGFTYVFFSESCGIISYPIVTVVWKNLTSKDISTGKIGEIPLKVYRKYIC